MNGLIVSTFNFIGMIFSGLNERASYGLLSMQIDCPRSSHSDGDLWALTFICLCGHETASVALSWDEFERIQRLGYREMMAERWAEDIWRQLDVKIREQVTAKHAQLRAEEKK